MKTHAFRLTTGADLKKSIEAFVADNFVNGGCVLTCVGGLSMAVLRMPGAQKLTEYPEDLEIISVQGTLSPEGCHIHASVSDADGNVFGGHLSDGCIVRLTAEVYLAEDNDYRFLRKYDEETRFNELVIK